MLVKRYTSNIYDFGDDVTCYCECFINHLKKNGYNIKSFRYLDINGNGVSSAWSFHARQFSVAFTNPNYSL